MSPLIGLHAQLACVWEATARKAGNVHPYAPFADLDYNDFLVAAFTVAEALSAPAGECSIGECILAAVQKSSAVVRSNVNLGILLLLAPLARCERASDLPTLLDNINIEETALVYRAIRLANPGGLGSAPQQDVAATPTMPLRAAMALAADRDLIARQYANGFREVFEEVAPALRSGLERTTCLEGAILWAQLNVLATHPDSLILRKRGATEAEEARRQAHEVLAAGWPEKDAGRTAFAELDAWLRAVGHQRNPGTTADLLAAGLFVLLRQGTIPLPCPWPWTCPE